MPKLRMERPTAGQQSERHRSRHDEAAEDGQMHAAHEDRQPRQKPALARPRSNANHRSAARRSRNSRGAANHPGTFSLTGEML
jgi:hypothetical protein